MIDDTRFYIDGAWADRPDVPRIAVTNPATEEVIGHIAAGSAADVDLAVAAARRAFETYSQWPVAERLALLERIKALLEERTEEFAQAILDGRPQPAPLEDAVANMACIDAIFRSSRSGRWEKP